MLNQVGFSRLATKTELIKMKLETNYSGNQFLLLD
jgi:hypothetical protein